MSSNSASAAPLPVVAPPAPPSPVQEEEVDFFDYVATVNELTIQLLSEHEGNEGGSSCSTKKCDRRYLLALRQSYFRVFTMNLLELFSMDRKLLDARDSLLIRQLCLNLNTERIHRTFAEILGKEQDPEFASDIVEQLNTILVTSPELAGFRKRLQSLEARLIPRLSVDLEIIVAMLVQIDKLVQLIQSPVLTYLHLQLLEPERYPYLFECLYDLLMLLPQSKQFVRLLLPTKVTRKWQDLLSRFSAVQMKHEKARRQALGTDNLPFSGFDSKYGDPASASSSHGSHSPLRRRVTGDTAPLPGLPQPPVLSPLNQRARQNGLLASTQMNHVPQAFAAQCEPAWWLLCYAAEAMANAGARSA
ncbi:vacuolar protein 14 C-terminal Fig4p binding-domain-containing protein [Melanogaster broomeanus]|nr:vacuolar protein 14 C-terminal Fig4p binding-domain-containing protein [Melanogaster broomeanus]